MTMNTIYLGCNTVYHWTLLIYAWLYGSMSDILRMFYKFFLYTLCFIFLLLLKPSIFFLISFLSATFGNLKIQI